MRTTTHSAADVLITKKGHPLVGQRLRIDQKIARRRDGFVQLLLPDGSPALVPLAWTDLAGPSESTDLSFTLSGLRAFAAIVRDLGSRT